MGIAAILVVVLAIDESSFRTKPEPIKPVTAKLNNDLYEVHTTLDKHGDTTLYSFDVFETYDHLPIECSFGAAFLWGYDSIQVDSQMSIHLIDSSGIKYLEFKDLYGKVALRQLRP